MPNILTFDEIQGLGDLRDFLKPTTKEDDEAMHNQFQQQILGQSQFPVIKEGNSDEFESHAEEVESHAEEVESHAEEVESHAEEVESHAEELDHQEKKDSRQPAFYSDADEYVCQNEKCKYVNNREGVSEVHVYEINANHTINICGDCYLRGYRFCLFGHDVLHLDCLDPVLESNPPLDLPDSTLEAPMKAENYYAHKERHQGQLDPDILSQITDLIDYFGMIGIENPCPHHTILDLSTAPVFATGSD